MDSGLTTFVKVMQANRQANEPAYVAAFKEVYDSIKDMMKRVIDPQVQSLQRRVDRSDVFQDAMASFDRGIKDGRFENAVDTNSSMRILWMLVGRKVALALRKNTLEKNAIGREADVSLLTNDGEEVRPEELAVAPANVTDEVVRKEIEQWLQQAMGGLNHQQRTVIAHKLEEYENSEIAEKLGVSEPRVRQIQAMALNKLREMWELESEDNGKD
jgi:RNA polymerase sigma factor (sigma-70 family)